MPFQVPASKASQKQNRFEFQFPGDRKTYSVPLINYLPPWLALKLKNADADLDEGVIRELFDTIAPGMGLFEKFEEAEQFSEWMSAWGRASGVTLGESPASAES